MPDQDDRDPRVYFAIERTFLAWTRTGLALMTFGFVIARLGLFLKQMQEMGGSAGAGGGGTSPDPSSPSVSLWIGTGVVLLGILVQALSLWEYQQLRRKFLAGQGIIGGGLPLPRIVGITLLVAGLGLAVYLVTLR